MIVKRYALAAFLPFLAIAAPAMNVDSFGRFGQSLEEAKKTDFFTFFHLAETGRDDHRGNQTIRFQPSGPKFHDLVTVDFEMKDGHFHAATMHLSRSFIDSPEQVFARDIAGSFLDAALSNESFRFPKETFLGQTVQQKASLKHMDVTLANTNSGGGQLMIRVELVRPEHRA